MKISKRITIRIYFKKSAETWPRVTLGDTEPVKGQIRLFAGPIASRAAVLKKYLPKYSIKQLAKDLFFLVLFHEFHHALAGTHDREKNADAFAAKAFKSYFHRPAVIPMRLWRNLPGS